MRTRAQTIMLEPGKRLLRRNGLHPVFGDVELEGDVCRVQYDEVDIRWHYRGIPTGASHDQPSSTTSQPPCKTASSQPTSGCEMRW